MKKIVITGTTGMIGSALARVALEQETEVLAIVRPCSKNINNLPQDAKIKIVECNLSDYSNLFLDGSYDGFFHLAWDTTYGTGRDNSYIQCNNIKYTLDAVKLAKQLGCSVFVGAGSQAEYGITDEKLSAHTKVNPQSAYGIAKYSAGKMSALLCSHLGMRHCWTRILSVYGKHDAPHTLIMYCIEKLLKEEKPSLTPCDQLWDYLYCGDAAGALFKIGELGRDQHIYCLGSGNAQPLREYIKVLRDTIDTSLPLGFGEKNYYHHQPMYLCAELSDLIRDTAFIPKTSFEDGINKTIKWYKERLNYEKN